MFNYDLSIIILTYNQSQFIEETLLSVFKQDIGCINLQLIISDDCSSDDTFDVVEKLCSKYSNFCKFRLIRNTVNQGVTKNFNNCLKLADSTFIMTLGGDDIHVGNKILTQYNFMIENSNVFISFHDALIFRDDITNVLCKYSQAYPCADSSFESLIKRGTFFTGSSVCVKNFVGLPFCNESILHASDWLWYIEIIYKSGGELAAVPDVSVLYRRHLNNITNNTHIDTGLNDTIFTLNYCYDNNIISKEAYKSYVSERYFAYSIKFLFRFNVVKFFLLLIKSLACYKYSPFLFLKLRFRRFFYFIND